MSNLPGWVTKLEKPRTPESIVWIGNASLHEAFPWSNSDNEEALSEARGKAKLNKISVDPATADAGNEVKGDLINVLTSPVSDQGNVVVPKEFHPPWLWVLWDQNIWSTEPIPDITLLQEWAWHDTPFDTITLWLADKLHKWWWEINTDQSPI